MTAPAIPDAAGGDASDHDAVGEHGFVPQAHRAIVSERETPKPSRDPGLSLTLEGVSAQEVLLEVDGES